MSKPTMMESSEDVVTANNTESPLRFRNDSSKHDEPAQKSFFTSAMSWIFPSSSSPTSAFDQTLDSAPVATEQPLVMVETEEQTAAILAKAIELAGPRPTDPVELAAYTSKVIDLVATIRAETQQEAKMNCPVRKLKLDFRMNLHQQDQDWIDKRKEFVEILKRLDRSPMDIFTEHFTEAQILYLIPPPKDNLILTIQKQHTKEYKMALGPEGPFRGVQDNLATKLTMLHFGMPIEPLTNNNLTHCADSDDKTNDPDDDSSAALAQRILFAEVPLEFLDKYDEGRSHGFPMLRKAKRRDPSASLATATPEPKTPTSALVSDGRAEAPLSVLGAATTPTGNGAGNDPIPTPASASSAQNSRLGQDRGYSRRPRNKAPSYRVHEPHFNPGQFTVSMRGGAGPDTVEDVDVETRMDQSSGENSSLTEEVYSNFIYGYNGKFLCENKMDSFKNAALRLLEYDFLTKPSWSFFVDIYPNENAKIPEKQLYVDGDAKLKMLWKGMKGHFHGPDKLGPWRVFVRNTGSHFSEGMLEPCRKGMKDIIRLIGPDNNQGNTTYWKIPKNTKLEYGINQCQPGFLRAMKMLYSHEPMPPQGHITLTFNDTVGSSGAHKFALAGGSMEATVQLWDAVSQEFANLNPDRNQTIDILVSCPSAPPLEPRQMTIHMVGSYITAGASFTDPEYTHNEIERTLNSYGGRPKSFRIWHAAEARDRGVPGKVIDFKPKELAIAKLKSFLHGWQGRTNCCWFSSEFTDFTVDALWDDGQVKQIAWSPGHGLASFRLALQNLVGQQEKLDSFTIVEAQSEVDGRRFVVTKNTSEREWRMHIYDWLTSNKLFVRKNANLDYLLSAHTFGSALAMKQPLTVNQKPTGQIEHAEGTTVAGAMEQTGAHRDHGLNATDRVAGGARPAAQTSNGQAGRTATMTSARPTRLNRERLVATVAGKPKSQKWADWMTEQHFQDDLQRRSWIKDQSVIEPGRMPAAPLFGPSRELQLGAGSSMPIVYAQHLTPSDIRQLQDENQKLRNQVLDRMAACLICDEEFETYDKDKIRGHMQHHHQQLKEAGRCPSCGEPQWAFMTNDEKRTHFAIHQVRNEGAKIKHFYEDQHCPVCDTDLSKMKPELVIAHCLNHAPGQVQYCDRCGLDEKDCNAEELRHHHHKCRLAKDRLVGDPVPFICTNCGADRTHETPEQNKHHQLHCRDRDPGRYCTKCGLNMTGPSWASADVIKHNQHCMPPSGFKKKYCQKCRAELFSLDTLGLSQHQQTCRLVEPVARSEQSRLTELKNRQFEARNLDALLSSRKAGIEARSKKQDDREAMLDARQKILDHKMSEHNDLYDQLQAAKKKGSSETDANQQTITEIFNGPTDCPYPQCATVIAAMNRVDLIKHLQRHMNIAPGFNCPLENAKGEKCNNHLSLKNDGFDLTVHYVHKLEDEQHAVLNQTVQDMGGEFRRLRDKVASAQPHFDSGVAFIHERQSDNKFQRISTGNAIIPPAAHQHDHGQDLHHIHEHGDHQHGQGQNPHHAHENEEHQHSHSQDPHHVDRHGVHHQQHQHDQRSAGETHNQNIATVKKTPSRAPKKPVDFPVSDATSTEAQPAAAGPAVTPLDVGAHAPIRPRLPRGVRDAERHTHQDDVAIKSYLSMISEDVEPEEDDPMRRNSVGIRPVVRRKPAAPNRKSYNESTAEILGGTGHGRRPSSLQKQIVDFGAERDTTSSSNKNILPDTTSKEDRASREDPVSTVSAAEKKRKQSGVDEEATASGNRAPAKKKPKKQKKVEEQVASPAKEPSKTVLTLPISQAGRSKSNAQEESEAVTESARRTRSSSRRATGNTTKR